MYWSRPARVVGPQPGKAGCEGEKGGSDPVPKPENRGETRILLVLVGRYSCSAAPGHGSSRCVPPEPQL